MPAIVEKCVREIHGTNKRTKKPYTQSEKWAICTAAHKKKQGKASTDENITEDEFSLAAEMMDKKMEACHQRMMRTGKAKSMEEAHQLCLKILAEASFDIDRMEFVLDLDLIKRR